MKALTLDVAKPHLRKGSVLRNQPGVDLALIRHGLLLYPNPIVAIVVRPELVLAAIDFNLEAHLGVSHRITVELAVVTDGECRHVARARANGLDGKWRVGASLQRDGAFERGKKGRLACQQACEERDLHVVLSLRLQGGWIGGLMQGARGRLLACDERFDLDCLKNLFEAEACGVDRDEAKTVARARHGQRAFPTL